MTVFCRASAALPLHLFCASALLVALPAPALAATGDPASADVLFAAGKQLAQRGQYPEACPKFEASYELDKTLGTLLNMADCHEHTGKLALAWSEWGAAQELASRLRDSRAAYAGGRQRAVAPRLARLTIRVDSPRSGLVVLRDGVPIEPAGYGVALPVDPGEHVVAVKRGADVLKEERVEVAERGTGEVKLDLEAIEADAPAPPTSAEANAARAGRQKALGLIVGGVGLGLLAGAAVFEILAITGRPGSDQCSEKFCTPGGLEAAHRAETRATVGQWIGVGGIALLGTGVALVLTTPATAPPRASASRPPPPRRAAWLAPWAGPSGAGVALGGAL